MNADFLEEISFVKNKVLEVLTKYNFDKSNFLKRYKDLSIGKSNNSDYSCRTNRLNYNGNIDECIHEMFHVASGHKGIVDGICSRKGNDGLFGVGLNEGITDMFASIAGSKKVSYPFEKACAETISDIFGMQIMKNYFDNNSIAFFNKFNNSYFLEFVDELDSYNHMIREIDTIYRVNGFKLNKSAKKKVKLIQDNAGSQLGIVYMAFIDFLESFGFNYKRILDDRMSSADMLDLLETLNVNLNDYNSMEL